MLIVPSLNMVTSIFSFFYDLSTLLKTETTFLFLFDGILSLKHSNMLSAARLTHSHTVTPFDGPGKEAF